ncbi:ester cyclase [Streptomyces sp. NPDC086777]|uniref:ester cyclase n=1 Tax=Streptomyces sp. NPDC086777 TaxID=3154866 RepID=UPI00344B71C6
MRSAFDGLRLPVLKSIYHGDQVWARLCLQGRRSGAFVLFKDGALDQVVPLTGREIDFEQIHVLSLRDHNVIRHEAVRDDVTTPDQLGGLPAEARSRDT